MAAARQSAAATLMQESLPQRRKALVENLEEYRRQRALALLEGKVFIHAEALADAEASLEAIQDAEGVVASRQRESAAQEEAARQKRVRDELRNAEAARIEAVERAETAALAMTEAFRDTLTAVNRINNAAGALPCKGRMTTEEVAERLSYRLSALLDGVDRLNRFGGLELKLHGNEPRGKSWVEAECRSAAWISEALK